MKEFEHKFIPYMPEQCAVSFVSTGSMGGDSGHGGNATLSIFENGSDLNVKVDMTLTNGEKLSFEDIKNIDITVFGDWEIEGLASALMDIGRKLLSRDDVLRDHIKWQLVE